MNLMEKILGRISSSREQDIQLLINELMQNQRFLTLCQHIIGKAIVANNFVKYYLVLLLKTLSMPSREDIIRIDERIDRLEMKVDDLLWQFEQNLEREK